MSLFTDIKILTTPNGIKVDKLYSVKPTNGDGDFTVVRNTTATYENSSGATVSAAIDTPRLDYSDGSCPTILLEPASSNLFPNSIFSGAVSGTPGTAPTGWGYHVNTGGSMTVESSAYASTNRIKVSVSSNRLAYSRNVYLTANTTYFLSSNIDIVTGVKIREVLRAVNVPSSPTQLFYIDGVSVASEAITLPSGKSTLGIAFTPTSSGYFQPKVGFGIYGVEISTNSVTFDLPQIEPLNHRTSYIPTTDATEVTRALDSIIDSGTSSDFDSRTGTLYLKAKALGQSGTDRVLSANDGTAANSASIVYDSVANTVNGVYTKAGVVIATCTAVITDVTATNKIAFTYEGSSFKLYVNGSLVNTLSSGSVTASNVFNSLDSNRGDNTLHLEAKVYEIQSYSKVLTLSEIASL